MTKPEFWEIIERSKQEVSSSDEQAEKLEKLLSELSADEIVSFDNIFTVLRHDAYRWDLWGVAYILCAGCSNDSFDYFRAWLIGRGQEFYDDAMADPESVAQKVTKDDYPAAEFLLSAAYKAYEAKTERPLPPSSARHPTEPSGCKWSEDDLPRLFPVAFEKEGICG